MTAQAFTSESSKDLFLIKKHHFVFVFHLISIKENLFLIISYTM